MKFWDLPERAAEDLTALSPEEQEEHRLSKKRQVEAEYLAWHAAEAAVSRQMTSLDADLFIEEHRWGGPVVDDHPAWETLLSRTLSAMMSEVIPALVKEDDAQVRAQLASMSSAATRKLAEAVGARKLSELYLRRD